jgi:hypothetical protein
MHVGEYDEAATLCAESVALWRQLREKEGLAGALEISAIVARNRGDPEQAMAMAEEALALFREVGNRVAATYSLEVVARAAIDLGDYDRAEALALFRESQDRWGIVQALSSLMMVAQRQDDAASIPVLCRESLALLRELGSHSHYVGYCYDGLAWWASARGEPERAARLLGAAETVRETIGMPLPPYRRPDLETVVASLQAALDERTRAAAWAAGRAMTPDEAHTYALEATAQA